ncbi:fluoride efflux transporter FluC [Streptomyces atratus]|uniref:fluoride efflux transporter FluC n=1 Tax=Streptomyces atratus TaxID=1893 RepID=UPI0036473C94
MPGPRLRLLLATGFCGAWSTWSAFSYELLSLTSARRPGTAAGHLLLSVAGGSGCRSPGQRRPMRPSDRGTPEQPSSGPPLAGCGPELGL